ncbi:MAG: urease accessory protein UreE [Burkholderiaceae bacterium]|nr:urease accessory protein UreE [Burkholderiaceae bacterium]
MIRLDRILAEPLPAGARVHTLRLTYDERVKSRLAALCEDGVGAAITLPRGSVLRDGALLAGPDGEYVRVQAAPQPLACARSACRLHLLRAAYHLGNRHVPVQLAEDHLLFERDAVLERMLQGLGLRIEHVEQPFDPEGGAYEGHAHGHTHRHHEPDPVSATLGEQLSIEAHRRRAAR